MATQHVEMQMEIPHVVALTHTETRLGEIIAETHQGVAQTRTEIRHAGIVMAITLEQIVMPTAIQQCETITATLCVAVPMLMGI
jgi:hypothetical protein